MNASGAWSSKKGRGSWHSVLLPGVLTAMAILVLTLTLTALLISKNKIDIERCSAAKLFYAAAVLAGCFLTARRAERRKLLWAALTAALTCMTVLGITFALPEVSSEGLGSMLVLTALAWLAGGFFGARKKKSGYL